MTVGAAVGGLGAAALAAGAYATLMEPRLFALRRVSAGLLRPQATQPLRILHLSDLHLQPRGRGLADFSPQPQHGEGPADRHLESLRQRGGPADLNHESRGRSRLADFSPQPQHGELAQFLGRCLAERPDLVVVTGDLLGHPDAVEPVVALLGPIARDRECAFVLGSNDRFAPTPKNPLRYFRRKHDTQPSGAPLDTAALTEGLVAWGWRQLDNRRLRVALPAGEVDVIGIGDAHIGDDRPREVSWTPPGDDVALGLGVTHAPYLRVLDLMDRAGLDLALAGHTHGGQVRVPGVGALVANCDLPLRQARGMSAHGAGLALHVSAGLGASRYAPFRFACRPEATLLELTPRQAAAPQL